MTKNREPEYISTICVVSANDGWKYNEYCEPIAEAIKRVKELGEGYKILEFVYYLDLVGATEIYPDFGSNV